MCVRRLFFLRTDFSYIAVFYQYNDTKLLGSMAYLRGRENEANSSENTPLRYYLLLPVMESLKPR